MEIFTNTDTPAYKTLGCSCVVERELYAPLSAFVIDGGRVNAWGTHIPSQGTSVSGGSLQAGTAPANGRTRAFGPRTVLTGGTKAGANGISVSGAGATVVGYDAAVPNPAIVDRNGNTRGIPPRIGPPIVS